MGVPIARLFLWYARQGHGFELDLISENCQHWLVVRHHFRKQCRTKAKVSDFVRFIPAPAPDPAPGLPAVCGLVATQSRPVARLRPLPPGKARILPPSPSTYRPIRTTTERGVIFSREPVIFIRTGSSMMSSPGGRLVSTARCQRRRPGRRGICRVALSQWALIAT